MQVLSSTEQSQHCTRGAGLGIGGLGEGGGEQKGFLLNGSAMISSVLEKGKHSGIY